MVEKKNKMTLVVLSGDMDKVMAAYIIASGAAAAGMEVIMFFTFWGLKAIQRDGVLTGNSCRRMRARAAGRVRHRQAAMDPSRATLRRTQLAEVVDALFQRVLCTLERKDGGRRLRDASPEQNTNTAYTTEARLYLRGEIELCALADGAVVCGIRAWRCAAAAHLKTSRSATIATIGSAFRTQERSGRTRFGCSTRSRLPAS